MKTTTKVTTYEYSESGRLLKETTVVTQHESAWATTGVPVSPVYYGTGTGTGTGTTWTTGTWTQPQITDKDQSDDDDE